MPFTHSYLCPTGLAYLLTSPLYPIPMILYLWSLWFVLGQLDRTSPGSKTQHILWEPFFKPVVFGDQSCTRIAVVEGLVMCHRTHASMMQQLCCPHKSDHWALSSAPWHWDCMTLFGDAGWPSLTRKPMTQYAVSLSNAVLLDWCSQSRQIEQAS